MCPSSSPAPARSSQLELSGTLFKDYLAGSRNPGSNIALVSVFLLFLLSHCGVGRDARVGRGQRVGSHLPVHGVGVGVGVGVGPDCAQYRPPVLASMLLPTNPPQMIMSPPLQTAV